MGEQILDRNAQESLIFLTMATIHAVVRGKSEPHSDEIAQYCQRNPELHNPMGAFVTIYVADELRGCLGEIDPEDPLVEVVLRCARRVPLHDRRFNAVQPKELPFLTFKISLLSDSQLLDSTEQLQIGTHGLIVRYKGLGGLLLPEVPVEYGWDIPTFIKHLWIKAGIDPSVPVSAVRLWSFTSQVINSTDFPDRNPSI